MRVFIAINFTLEMKHAIVQSIQSLKKCSVSGNYTSHDNLHLTLAFLGEVSKERIGDIIKVMHQTAEFSESMDITIHGLGKFINRGGCLYWLGVKENRALQKMQKDLVLNLKEDGFQVDDKPFKPHITLGRKCVMRRDFDEKSFGEKIAPMLMRVTAISLMLSEQKQGKVTYTELERIRLRVTKKEIP